MKKIYQFTVNKIETVDQEECSTQDGKTIKTITKVQKEIPHKFCIKKPGREMLDNAALFYGVKVSEGIKAGLLTIPLLEKRNLNDGGVFSEEDKTEYFDLFEKLYNLEKDFQKLEAKKEEELTEEEKKEKKNLLQNLTSCRTKLQEYEMFRNSIYDHTAEVRARNMTLTWWLVSLAYAEIDEKEVPYFGEGSYEQKLAKYDELIEKEDEFINTVITKFLTYITLWSMNKASTPEEFERLEKALSQPNPPTDTKETLDTDQPSKELESNVEPKVEKPKKPQKEEQPKQEVNQEPSELFPVK